MLYDILIIDDDFSDTPDSQTWQDNANNLLCDLIADNLRVTWTTGEHQDLKRLQEKDLSSIKYIFLDLHLTGINATNNYNSINGKILGILEKINCFINSKKVTCFINSKHIKGDNYGTKGQDHLDKGLKGNFSEKYTLEAISEKNVLTDKQKELLKANLLAIYAKTLIINKALDIEAIFDEKLEINERFKDVITFENKYKKFRDVVAPLTTCEKKQIQLLQQIRNKLAHSSLNDLKKIKDIEMKKVFWKIQNQKTQRQILFNDFEVLTKYVQSINDLCESLKKTELIAENGGQKN